MKKIALKLALGLSLMNGLVMASNHALLIGCCDKYAKLKKITPLYGTSNDVTALKKILIESGTLSAHNTRSLLNTQATKKNIVATLTSMLTNKNLKRGDTLYLYYSGHGSSSYDSGFFGKKIKEDKQLNKFLMNTTALVPYDVDTKNLYDTLIITKRDFKPLFEKLDKKGIKIVWITDACYAGNAYRSGNAKKDKHAPFSYHETHKKSNTVNYQHLLFYGASLATLPTQEHRHNGEMRGDFSFELEQCLRNAPNSTIRHKELKKCLNSNFANTQIQHNYYPQSTRLDNQIVMRVPHHTTRRDMRELLFKLQSQNDLLDTDIISLDSKRSRVIKSFCNHEKLSVKVLNNTQKYLLAFTKDKKGKVIMLQPDSKNPIIGNELFRTVVQPPFGTDKIKIFATNDENIYKTALKFSNRPNGVLSTADIEEIYKVLKKSGNFRTANLTVETIKTDVKKCIAGD